MARWTREKTSWGGWESRTGIAGVGGHLHDNVSLTAKAFYEGVLFVSWHSLLCPVYISLPSSSIVNAFNINLIPNGFLRVLLETAESIVDGFRLIADPKMVWEAKNWDRYFLFSQAVLIGLLDGILVVFCVNLDSSHSIVVVDANCCSWIGVWFFWFIACSLWCSKICKSGIGLKQL